MCKAYDDVLCPALVNFKEFAVIHDAADDLVHIVRLVRTIRDDFVQGIVKPGCRVVCRNERRFLHIVLRDETDDVLDDLDSLILVLCGEMRYTALGCVYACPSEIFLADNLSGHGLDHSRTCKEHIGGVLDHNVEVGQGRGVNRSSCTGTEYSRNLWNNSRSEDVPLENLTKACKGADSFLNPCSA